MEENKSAAKLREERLLEKQRLAEKARIALLEEKMDERIFELRKTLAQTTDLLIRGDLQVLLNEEEQKREIYYEKKRLAESQAQQIQLAVDKTLVEPLSLSSANICFTNVSTDSLILISPCRHHMH